MQDSIMASNKQRDGAVRLARRADAHHSAIKPVIIPADRLLPVDRNPGFPPERHPEAEIAKVATRKLSRDEIPKSANLCDYCTAKCCRYIAVVIDTPETWNDFDTIRWFLVHENTSVFTEKKDWYLLMMTNCRHLRGDNLCGIYHTRPLICRKYSTRNCEYEDSWVYDRLLETPEQVEEYAEALLGPRRKRAKG